MEKMLALAVPVLIALAPSIAAAEEITAVGPRSHAERWLQPDANGVYTLRIDIADLDPATPAGWQVMARRVAFGTSNLCDAAQQGTRLPGYYDSVQRACLSETRSAAQVQMEQARAASRAGRPAVALALAVR